MKIYLAGPMSHLPYFNYPAFYTAAAALRSQGHQVFNPAEEDVRRDGVRWDKLVPNGDPKKAAEQGFSLRRALAADFEYICKEADAIALLPNWEASTGAPIERSIAVALGLEVIEL